ncbi:hypothetical protein [Leucothrix pacifica]|uniref:Uncharacterized protein n=1 Tax=Leucothrix pacifica TaxID=1247513 RepID=A0A317C0X6_9GAMM|nr:hypothetical protein [Leucothrix pacifica]PWQ92007.1 hypothetical protein DKW60_23430 [Leucothrix pacifica]
MNERIKNKNITNATKLKHAIDFIEELSWLLESKGKLKLSEIPNILRDSSSSTESVKSSTRKYVSPNPNIHYLIGVLPRLFQDTKIFPKNEDIVAFANEVLNIDINRSDKRSRYELIGLIVCESNMLNDNALDVLVEALTKITEDTEKIRQMAKERSVVGFSWNETIRRLADKDDS